ncbi:MAG TPA: type II secretion system minor pseudopilin GspK [Myxococcota bacterium]|nr:type II secretion system minor pseudopilin GspK [Myxococcota bacterium]
MTRRPRDERGFMLVVALVFVLLLTASIVTFQRRAMLDWMIAHHRDAAAEAEAAARGGVRLGITLLLEDRLEETVSGFKSETLDDVWARASGIDLPAQDGVQLRLKIEDAGARLNLNALLDKGHPRKYSELFLTNVLDQVIQDIPSRANARSYDSGKLARNLLDYISEDEVGIGGGPKDEPYQRRKPPGHAASRPLLSVDELRLVEGFDGELVEALRPYVTVYPYARADGINPNTAPPHVLALLFHGLASNFRLATEAEVKSVLKARDQGDVLCADSAKTPGCQSIGELLPGEIFPPPTFASNVFTIRAEAKVGEVRRTIEAVVDRSKPSQPQLLAWRVE